jgi:hypothetical protein
MRIFFLCDFFFFFSFQKNKNKNKNNKKWRFLNQVDEKWQGWSQKMRFESMVEQKSQNLRW